MDLYLRMITPKSTWFTLIFFVGGHHQVEERLLVWSWSSRAHTVRGALPLPQYSLLLPPPPLKLSLLQQLPIYTNSNYTPSRSIHTLSPPRMPTFLTSPVSPFLSPLDVKLSAQLAASTNGFQDRPCGWWLVKVSLTGLEAHINTHAVRCKAVSQGVNSPFMASNLKETRKISVEDRVRKIYTSWYGAKGDFVDMTPSRWGKNAPEMNRFSVVKFLINLLTKWLWATRLLSRKFLSKVTFVGNLILVHISSRI